MSYTQPRTPRPLFQRPAPGYFQTKRVLSRLRRFQNLIRHKERWGADLGFACPIEELIPPNLAMAERFPILDREILRAMNIVRWDINRAGVTTGVIYKHWDTVEGKEEKESYDVILDYFRLPRLLHAQQAYEAVMSTLEQAIGVYENRLIQSKRELYNPVVWAAHIIRLPITVMERAGMIGHEKTDEMVLGGYATFMKISMAIILALVAVKLGITFPWKDVFVKILELIK
jgi:hypothetical protein